MSGQQADGVYNRRAWSAPTADAPNPPQEYLGPFSSNQERLLTQSLATWNMSASEIQEYVRPPLPQVKLFPSRYGFTEYEITIEDIVQMPRRGQQRVESDFSQTPNTTQSSSRNTLGGSV
jgi:hypothetical protein